MQYHNLDFIYLERRKYPYLVQLVFNIGTQIVPPNKSRLSCPLAWKDQIDMHITVSSPKYSTKKIITISWIFNICFKIFLNCHLLNISSLSDECTREARRRTSLNTSAFWIYFRKEPHCRFMCKAFHWIGRFSLYLQCPCDVCPLVVTFYGS